QKITTIVMMTPGVKFALNAKLHLKDPQSSELGRKILTGSIDLIDELGFESFTFKKLAIQVGSTEASVYRYFESKHKLLLYLSAWYWHWMDYRMMFRLANIVSPRERLNIAVTVLTEIIEQDSQFSHINEVKLNRIIIGESSKCYLTKEVDEENKKGVFLAYKRLVQSVCDIILEIQPGYKYPHMLVSTVVEGAHLQRFFADHLPRLTDTVEGEDSVTSFYKEMLNKVVGEPTQNHKK
ncbi:MAG: TetR/AcrR family transcriptional regulator, partial [Flavobacteriales bacterium]